MSERELDIARRLARHPVFAALDNRARRDLARVATRRDLEPDSRLFFEGERADHLVVVFRGQLDVERISIDGARRLYRRLGTDAVIGLSAVAGGAHSADVVARTDSRVLTIPGDALRDAFARHPAAALAAIAALGDLVARLSDELAEATGGPLVDRVMRRLERLAGGRRDIDLTHGELAAQLGAERASVSRALAELEERGWLRRHRGRLELLASSE